jgi:hypothetical protein
MISTVLVGQAVQDSSGGLLGNRGYARGPNDDRARTGLGHRPSSHCNIAHHRGAALPSELPSNAGEYSIRYAICNGSPPDTNSRPPRQDWDQGSLAERERIADVVAGQS